MLKKLSANRSLLLKALGFVATYALWILLLKLVVVTFVTYFFLSSGGRLQDISEALGSNEVVLAGLSAFLFVLCFKKIDPLHFAKSSERFTAIKLEKMFLPGFFHGAILATGIVLAFLLSGHYRYIGYFIRFDEVVGFLANVLVRMVAIGAMVYYEEFIFRKKLAGYLSEYLAEYQAEYRRAEYPQYPLAWSGWQPGIILICSGCYCLVKVIQFDIGIMQSVTLFLASVALSARMALYKDFSLGAGFFTAILVVFHPLLGLPIFGNDFTGAVLIKYNPVTEGELDGQNTILRFLTGGIGGPLSSFSLQSLLFLDILRSMIKNKKFVLKKHALRLR